MKLAIISHPDCNKHQMTDQHPESPNRVTIIQQYLKDSKIQSHIDDLRANKIDLNLLELAHDKKYIETLLNQTPEKGLISLDPDTYMNPATLNAALRSAGSVIQGLDLLFNNQYQRVFCNVRPPGHHATRNQAMGFCFFNNVAIGALYALKKLKAKRVAIIDFDAHQGNGTIDIIKDIKDIFYGTSYQYPFYPFVDTPKSDHMVGIPIAANTPMKIVRKEYKTTLFPKLNDFQPEVILISAGFDGFQKDPLTNLSFTEDDYYWITSEIVKIANQHAQGRIISVLEGGYKIPELGACALAHCYALIEELKNHA